MNVAMLLGLVPIPQRPAGVRASVHARINASAPSERTEPLTRGEVLEAIRAYPSTSAELALELGVSKRAVGMHVTRLVKAGAVRARGSMPTGGRDAAVWEAVEERRA